MAENECVSSIQQPFSFDNHIMDMDCFIQLQFNRLRRSMLEQHRHSWCVLRQHYESILEPLVVQKEEELSIGINRMRNLHEMLKVAEMEAKAWEKAARQREVSVSNLRKKTKETMSFSACSSSGGEGREMMKCKMCRNGKLCVVLLPCRHLCCCKMCEPLLEKCPLCLAIKDSAFEAFFD